ncbi:pyridoxal phosphate-dependent decarboxylase family protein [Paraburkholderia humisilvae]|uniref:Tryptophan decarboxylase n=1 Tax=Paraburkholderia humisilvae TaxID=627669 RepID=A0A6J5F7X0_9BURK|nr:aminotransferase class V-fold PLP-dependent enzyme [Paraburkholderia humisilvae]CAB3774473.1 Tryptophan decarboxylase [Paraburkholderia humisilvae]
MAMLREMELPVDTMRTLGYRAVDLIIDHHAHRTEHTVVGATFVSPAIEETSRPPEHPTPPGQVLEQAHREILSSALHADHPLNFGRIPGPAMFIGALGDMLAAGFNACAVSTAVSPGATRVEQLCATWLANAIGLAPGSGGIFVSGGSVANLMAVVLARDRHPGEIARLVAYCSDQTHPSIRRALRIAGLSADNLRTVPVDDAFRIDLTALHTQIAADQHAGRIPFLLIANAGTTNTGSVDPLREMGRIATRYGMWFHVDGAFGAAAAMGTRAVQLFDGLANADSVTIDPHKWLFQPYAISCLLIKSPEALARSFYLTDVYLQDDQQDPANLSAQGIEVTRPFRALKLWMSITCHGMAAIRRAIDHGIELAEHAAKAIEMSPDLSIVTLPSLGVLTFACRAGHLSGVERDALHEQVSRTLIADGHAVIFCTTVHGRRVFRMCVINPLTTRAGIERTLLRVVETVRNYLAFHAPLSNAHAVPTGKG